MSQPNNTSFQGVFIRMDESLKLHPWGNANIDEASQTNFMQYMNANQSSRHQAPNIQTTQYTEKRVITQGNRSAFAEKFKKLKFTQIQTLKQLKQQYQILKNIQVQDDLTIKQSNIKKQSVSMNSSQRDPQAGSESTSSKPSKHLHKKKQRESQSLAKDNHYLSLEKKQLELLTANSMRKIEQLLNNQIQFKKIIHRQQLQLDSRNNDSEIQNLMKTIKTKESQYNQKVQNFKKQNEKLKGTNYQLLNKIISLQNQLQLRNSDEKRWRQQRRTLQNSNKIQKQRYLTLQIQLKKTKMQMQLLQKQKNGQINRIKSLLSSHPRAAQGNNDIQNKKILQQLTLLRTRYNTLLHQNQRYRSQLNTRPKQFVIKQQSNQELMRIFQALITHLREQAANQSRASIDLISSMVAKIDEKKERQREQKLLSKSRSKQKKRRVSPPAQTSLDASHKLLEQMYNLKNQVSMLKRQRDELSRSAALNNLTQSMTQYANKIQKLQEQVVDGTISKENLLKQYEILKSSYNYTKEQYQKISQENQKLKQRLNRAQRNNQMSSQQQIKYFKQKQLQYEQTIRQIRRQLDEALFQVQKAKQQGQFNINLIRNENQSKIRLKQEQVTRAQNQRQALKAQLLKMRSFYDAKLQQKNMLAQRTAQQFAALIQTKQSALIAYKANSEKSINELIMKIEGVAALNQRYLRQSNQLALAERQLHQLRYAVRKLKGLNDGVDHLWQVKETQYGNLIQVVKQMTGSEI